MASGLRLGKEAIVDHPLIIRFGVTGVYMLNYGGEGKNVIDLNQMLRVPLPIDMKSAKRGIELAIYAVKIPRLAVVPRSSIIRHLFLYGFDRSGEIGRSVSAGPGIPVIRWQSQRRFSSDMGIRRRMKWQSGRHFERAGRTTSGGASMRMRAFRA